MRRSRWTIAAAGAVLALAATGALAGTRGARDKVTVEIWDWGSPPPSAFKVIDDAYMHSHPGITIKRVHQPFNSFFTLQRTAVATRKGPDVFESYASPFIFDYYRGELPLSKLVTPAQRTALIGWNYVSSNLSSSGTPYAFPWSGQGINFYYNKALFKQAGLNPGSPPKTWAQFLAACAALKKAGIVPISAGFKEGYYAEWWVDVLSMQLMSKSELAQNYSKPNWENPAVAKAWSLLLDLYKKGYMTPNSQALPLFPDTVNNFGAGKAAMILALSANNANYSEFRKDKVSPNLGAFLPPLVPGAKITKQVFDFGPGLSWIVSSWSSHSKEAFDYLSYLGQPKTQETIFKLSGTFPNNKLAKPKTSDKVGNQILGWIRQYPAYVGQVTLIRSNVEAIYDKVVPQVITGGQSVADAMKQVQQEQDRATPIPTK